jgi:tetratricopeptide (TPR) repeat protein
LAAGNRREEAEALRLLGMIFGGSGDEERGEALLEEALEVFRTIGDKRGVATALSNLGAGMSGRDPGRAVQLLRESIALDRELGDRVQNDWVLATLAEIELLLENLERAEELVLEALTTQRQYDLRAGLCWSLQVLGWTRLAQDDPHSAGDAFEEALNVTRETGQNSYLTTLFVGRGRVDLRLGRTTEAAEQFGRALSQIQEHGLSAFWPEEELVLILRDLAEMRLAQGQPDTAARLLGAAQALPQIGIAAMTSESKSREELTDRARSMLDDDVFAREHSAGMGMTPEEILAEAVAQAAAIATGRGKSGTGNRVYDRSM